MITIELTGGLGNQMFAYAAGYAAARRLGTTLCIRRAHGTSPVGYGLDWLQVPQANVVEQPRQGPVARRMRRYLPGPGRFRERRFHYDPRFETVRDGTLLEGYFQSWRYMAGAEEELRRQFQPAAPLSAGSAAMKAQIAAAAQPIALHVRRGDYLDPLYAPVHGALPPHYYGRAIALLSALVPGGQVFLFSDDLGWAMGAIGGAISATPVAGNTGRPWEDLALMGMCHHHIIANSSFSWWGAWLGTRPGQVVVAPRQWFTPEAMRLRNTADLYPPDWYLA